MRRKKSTCQMFPLKILCTPFTMATDEEENILIIRHEYYSVEKNIQDLR